MAKIQVEQIKSSIGCNKKQRNTLTALGLRGIGKTRVHENNDAVKGMINVVSHLVKVTEVN